jgi:hypothetical protein
MQHTKLHRSSTAAKRCLLTAAVAAAATAAILTTTAATSATTQPAPRPAATQTTTQPAATAATAARTTTAAPAAARTAAPDAALARAFRRYFRHQAATGMTTWLRTGIEHRNQATLIQARLDAWPHRDAALPADSAALLRAARNGLAHPSPEDTAGWDKIMHNEITIARELPVIPDGNAATALAPVIQQEYLTYTQHTS